MNFSKVRSLASLGVAITASFASLASAAQEGPDPLAGEQWNLHDAVAGARVGDAWKVTRGEGSVIAIIGSGITSHEDLDAHVLPGYDFISDHFFSRDGDGRDDDAQDEGDWREGGSECGLPGPRSSTWDGTHVAGIAMAVGDNGAGIAGVAPRAKLLPVRSMSYCGGTLQDVVDGITWATGGQVPGVPDNRNPARIVQMQTGAYGPCPVPMAEAIDEARRRGAVIITGAANDADDAALANPANCPGVIVVAASDRRGGLARYSSYGPIVSLSAPGGSGDADARNYIVTTYDEGRTVPTRGIYQVVSGTGVAAAHVSGTAALMLSAKPSLSSDDVTRLLVSSTRTMPVACRRPCGSGLLDTSAALTRALE
ncbi:S8 family serine peptidase [Pinirhizobacter sp.]|uniref:S8 family serine peptidase n=1 Tax=Pinirhizobacter sp. TaxID=2950432 RepID=UPI002F42922B